MYFPHWERYLYSSRAYSSLARDDNLHARKCLLKLRFIVLRKICFFQSFFFPFFFFPQSFKFSGESGQRDSQNPSLLQEYLSDEKTDYIYSILVHLSLIIIFSMKSFVSEKLQDYVYKELVTFISVTLKIICSLLVVAEDRTWISFYKLIFRTQ